MHFKAKPVSHSKYAQFAQLEDYYKRVKRRNPLFSYDNIVVEHGNTATTTRTQMILNRPTVSHFIGRSNCQNQSFITQEYCVSTTGQR